MDNLDISSSVNPEKDYIRRYNLYVIKHIAIFKEYLYGCFWESVSVI